MANLLLLNIGTGHGSTEQELITSKLRTWSRYKDIGVVGNHMRGGVGGGAHGRKKDDINIGVPTNNGWVYTNEGQSSAATGMLDQTKANVALIKDLHNNHENIEEIYMVGHSRGCILSLRIAAFIYEQIPEIDVYLFLIDPVKRMSRGTDFYNRQVHANVQDIQIVAMEDPSGAGGTMFHLMSVRRKTGKNVEEVNSDRYIRMPGSHGTATQVDGHPIGQATVILALRFLTAFGVPFDAPMPTDNKYLNSTYMKINLINPINAQGQRKINDGGDYSLGTAGARDLSSIKQNHWHGSGFFINNHHYAIFNHRFSALFTWIVTDALNNVNGPQFDDANLIRKLRFEYRQWEAWDPYGKEILEKHKRAAFGQIKTNCGIN